jgi:hypothetical protein
VSFDPGVSSMKDAGILVSAAPYPEGDAGIRASLRLMAEKMREGRNDSRVKRWAIQQLRDKGIDGRDRTPVRVVVQILLDALRAQTSYSADPIGTEFIPSAVATLCLDPALCVRADDCFPAGTMLLRDDYTLVSVESIRVGDRIWGRDQWTRVEAVVAKGPLSVDAVRMNNGSTMQLTGDHHAYVLRCDKRGDGHKTQGKYGCSCPASGRRIERVRVRDLKKYDVLLQPEKIAIGTRGKDPGVAYIEGLYASDGWSIEDMPYRFHISGKDGCRKEAQKREVKAICDRLGVKTNWQRRYITVKDAAWTREMMKLGLHARHKHVEAIDLEESALSELLRGVMADSSGRAQDLTFSTTSRLLMMQARVMHRMFGRSCSVSYLTPEQHGGEGQHPLWRLGVRIHRKKSVKMLRVRALEREAFTVPCYDIQTEDHYVYLPEHDVTVSNCDGLTVALGTATMSIGIPTRIVKQNFGGGAQQHVLIAVQDENGRWLHADPSTRMAVGEALRADEEWIDPMDTNPAGTAGGAQIVSLGRAHGGGGGGHVGGGRGGRGGAAHHVAMRRESERSRRGGWWGPVIVEEPLTCGAWSEPLAHPDLFLQGAAMTQLTLSGGSPVTQSFGGVLYLFERQPTGTGVLIRQCLGVGAAGAGAPSASGHVQRMRDGRWEELHHGTWRAAGLGATPWRAALGRAVQAGLRYKVDFVVATIGTTDRIAGYRDAADKAAYLTATLFPNWSVESMAPSATGTTGAWEMIGIARASGAVPADDALFSLVALAVQSSSAPAAPGSPGAPALKLPPMLPPSGPSVGAVVAGVTVTGVLAGIGWGLWRRRRAA